MLKIAVAGAHGHLGQCLVKALEADPDAKCSALIVHHPKTSDEYTLEMLYKSYTKGRIACWIDFSTPHATLEHLQFCLDNKIPMVIGTTGFNNEEKAKISQAANSIPIVFAPNMSIGINLLYKLIEISSLVLKDTAETAILDIHRKHKKDAPSGTALKMNEIITNSTKSGTASSELSNQNVVSLRIGNALGEHQIWFTLEGEEIVLSHKTRDRVVYAKGAILAAKWLIHQVKGLYDMHDVLNLKEVLKKESYV